MSKCGEEAFTLAQVRAKEANECIFHMNIIKNKLEDFEQKKSLSLMEEKCSYLEKKSETI